MQGLAFVHGSLDPLPVGLVLRPRSGWHSGAGELDALFEACRPSNRIARHEAVFVCADPDDIDACGGYTEPVYEVAPIGEPERSDLAWCAQAQIHLEAHDTETARTCALADWGGLPFPDPGQSVGEFRARAAIILRDIDDGTDD